MGISVVTMAVPSLLNGNEIKPKKEKPNIIYILADDLGYNELGCYGQDKIKTPFIDKMALEGIRFTQHYAGCAVCAPSRSALLEGKHSGHCYIRGNKEIGSWDSYAGQEPLPQNTNTFAKMLKMQDIEQAL